MNRIRWIGVIAVLMVGRSFAAAPTDPKAKAVYDHNREWLAKFPTSFIAANIRGQGTQYAERRQAALDLLREKRDFSTVPELVQELRNKSFLSAQICELLGDWHSKTAVPVLQEVEADRDRDSQVREKARKAIDKIARAPKSTPPPGYSTR